MTDLRDLAVPGDFITAERWNTMQLAIYDHIRDEVAALQANIDASMAARVAGGSVSRKIAETVGVGTDSPAPVLDVNGSIRADNIVTAEAFSAFLTNGDAPASSDSGSATLLRYTDIQQNTAADVFDMKEDGSLVIKRAGVVSISASMSIVTEDGRNADMVIEVNGNATARARLRRVPSDSMSTGTIGCNLHWRVAGDDIITIRPEPYSIRQMDAGTGIDAFQILSVQWVGVRFGVAGIEVERGLVGVREAELLSPRATAPNVTRLVQDD